MAYVVICRVPVSKYRRAIRNLTETLHCELDLRKNVSLEFRKIKQEDQKEFQTGEVNYDSVYKEHNILINSQLLFADDLEATFKTVCHEMYHCYQHEKKIYISESRASKFEEKCMKSDKYKVFIKEVSETAK